MCGLSWLGCSPCLAASWDHVLRVPRERCRFKEEENLGRDLDFFPPFPVFLLPCFSPSLHLARCTHSAGTPRMLPAHISIRAEQLCGVPYANPIPSRSHSLLTPGACSALLRDHPASCTSPHRKGEEVDSAPVFVTLRLQANCQGEGGARLGLRGIHAAGRVVLPSQVGAVLSEEFPCSEHLPRHSSRPGCPAGAKQGEI